MNWTFLIVKIFKSNSSSIEELTIYNKSIQHFKFVAELELVIVKSAENQSVFCFEENGWNLLTFQGSLKSKKLRKQTPHKMTKTRGF